jgi:hypothetical protein
MTVIIRPSPDVFRRNSRVLVILGAYRRYDSPYSFLPGEDDALASMISKARNYRVQLAFCRRTRGDGSGYPGSWMPGCRPLVTDMVFNHRDKSAFSNPEMLSALRRRGDDCPSFAAPTHDSEIRATIYDATRLGLHPRRVALSKAMQFCSAIDASAGDCVNFPPQPGQTDATGYRDWINSLRTLESTD